MAGAYSKCEEEASDNRQEKIDRRTAVLGVRASLNHPDGIGMTG